MPQNKLLLLDDDEILAMLEALVVYSQLNLAPGDIDYNVFRSLIHRLQYLLK